MTTQAMSYEEAVRIAAELDGSVIPHSSFQRADEEVTRCIIQSRYNREPECCAVIGPSGSGKTLPLRRSDRADATKTDR